MISVESYIELLKEKNLWVSDQSITSSMLISGKPETDSRILKKEDVFICIKGLKSDGHNYVKHARAIGIQLIVLEDEYQDDMPAIRVRNSRKAAALLSKLYFNNPTEKFTLIGVTGTNGKTTTSMLIWQALTDMGLRTGWIGTLGYIVDSEIIETNNTTPDILELNGIFAQMVEAGSQYVVMEVSSHALALDRVYGLSFDIAIFLNLSRDHLDFHKDMTDYFESKYILFKNTLDNGGKCIINSDDEQGNIIVTRNAQTMRQSLVTVSEISGDVTIIDYKSSLSGSEINIRFDNNSETTLSTELIGHFNILNLTMAVTTIKVLFPDINNAAIKHIAMGLKPVRGRLEKVSNSFRRGIFVDYAHTPDALKNVLETLIDLPHRRLLVVFGAGGDRDKGKRSDMLREVLHYSDATIITDDNPRFENPNQIIMDVVGDNDLWKPWWIIRDRETAIKVMLKLSQENDIILIAGKGHETYQEISGIKYPFDDVKIAGDACKDNLDSKINNGELSLPIHPLMLELLYNKPSQFNPDIDCVANCLYKHISTDSRNINPDSVYFAIKGENYDGHDYIDKVLEDNTCCAISSIVTTEKQRTFCYSDTQDALGLLAKKYLLMFSVFKIALTGSTGKTTTKEYIANIFSVKGPVLKTVANENNIIGLSKTIFRVHPEHKTAVFELGTNHFGEIETLADICNPDLGIITNIGPSHLEFLNDESGVYSEKTALFRREITTIIYPGDDNRFSEFATSGKSVGYSNACSFQISDVIIKGRFTEIVLNGSHWKIPQLVPFLTTNSSFAIACAIESGISDIQIQEGLLKTLDLQMRMEILQDRNRTIIMDCYNANPVSMNAALEFWYSYFPENPHVAILGDMLELGEKSIDYHENISAKLQQMGFDALFTIGKLSMHYADSGFSNKRDSYAYQHFQDVDEFINSKVIFSQPDNAVILIKASHGLHLEKIKRIFENNSDASVSKNSSGKE